MALADLISNKQVSDLLLDPKIYDTLEKIAKTYRIPTERAEEFLDLTESVMDEVIPFAEMPAVIGEAFGLSDDLARKVAADVAGQRLLAFANYLPGLEKTIGEWGGDVAQYPKLRIPKEKLAAAKFAERIKTKAKVELPEASSKRFGFLLWELVTDKRTPEQFREFLTRRGNAGGLELKSEAADRLFVEAIKERNSVDLVDEDAIVPHATKPVKPTSNVNERSLPKTALKPNSSHPLGVDKNERELQVAKKKAEKVVRKVAKSPKEALAQAVEVAVEAAEPAFGKTVSEKLFRDIAEKAIRGVRDIYQTRDVLEQGNGVSGTTLTTLLEGVKQGQEAYDAATPPQSPPLRGGEAGATTPVHDAEVMDRRFAKMTKSKSTQSSGSLMPGARVSAARTSEEELQLQAEKVGLDAAALQRPAPARAEITVGSVPVSKNGQRKVTDVVAAHRLMGPVQQLGALSPADFRRLSSDATEAAQRVEDLIASLTSTAYEERVKGIEAWRQSPMNQLYLTMAEEALAQGISIPEIGSRRRSAGQESLSPAEIKAIAGLNARIRF